MTNALPTLLQRYLAGDETPYDGLALLRPYLVAACLADRSISGEGLVSFMLTLHTRGDQPTLLHRLRRYAAARDPDLASRFEAATAPLFSQTTIPEPAPSPEAADAAHLPA